MSRKTFSPHAAGAAVLIDCSRPLRASGGLADLVEHGLAGAFGDRPRGVFYAWGGQVPAADLGGGGPLIPMPESLAGDADDSGEKEES